MASIIDSFRETFSDHMSFFKLLVLAVPVYFSYTAYVGARGDFSTFNILAGITLFFVFGFLVRVTHNVISEADYILPSMNPIELATVAVKGLLAIGPIALISSWIAIYACSLIKFVDWLDVTLKSIIWIVASAVIVTSFLMFSKKEKIMDVLKLKVLSAKAGDLIIILLFFVAQLVIVNFPTTILIGYIIFVLFGYGPYVDFYLAFVVVFNVAVIGHYMAQVHYELFFEKD